MRPLHSNNPHNIIRFCIDKAIVCSTNLLIQKRLTQYIRNLMIPEGKPSFGQSSKDKSSRINKLVLRILYFKSYPKLGFCGGCYCAVVSQFKTCGNYNKKALQKLLHVEIKNKFYFTESFLNIIYTLFKKFNIGAWHQN